MSRVQPFALACTAALVATATQAQQQQKVSGPQARYWMGAETSSGAAGMAGGGIGAAMSILGGGGGGANKSLRLELRSQREANPASGQHQIPQSMSMGASLPLAGLERVEYEKGEREPNQCDQELPEKEEGKNMRILYFWGCGAQAGPGQPYIFDMRSVQRSIPTDLCSVNSLEYSHSAGTKRDRGYADWPNARDSKAVPAQASLVGDHVVSSNIANDIRFAVGAANDYLGPLQLVGANQPNAGRKLSWNNLDRALGYSASGMGINETSPRETDLVMWSSSEKRMLSNSDLTGFLPPHEVRRLVAEKVIMPPGTTECVISQQAIDAAGGSMLTNNLNAFGPELNHIHPPRPQDVNVEWKQEYAVKLRTRSHTSIFDMGAGGGGRSSRRAGADPSAGQATPARSSGIGGILGGIFGGGAASPAAGADTNAPTPAPEGGAVPPASDLNPFRGLGNIFKR